MSTNTGFAPVRAIANAEDIHVLEVVITSSFFFKFNIFNATIKASVPEFTSKLCLILNILFNCTSNFLLYFPLIKLEYLKHSENF